MKTSKTTKILLAVLLLVTAAAAAVYLLGRDKVPENTIAVDDGNTVHYADLQGLRLEEIHGERLNGKGETKPADGVGTTLYNLLTWTLGKDFTCTSVTVEAADGFHAEVSMEEMLEENKAVLLLNEEEGSFQLIVFGDSDSKRSVKNVERLTLN